MAVSFSVVRRSRQGNLRSVIVDMTGPASYTTGGEALTVAQYNALFPETHGNANALPANANNILVFDAEPSTGGHTFVLDRANLKVMAFNGTTQITAATNLSAVTARVAIVYQVSSG